MSELSMGSVVLLVGLTVASVVLMTYVVFTLVTAIIPSELAGAMVSTIMAIGLILAVIAVVDESI